VRLAYRFHAQFERNKHSVLSRKHGVLIEKVYDKPFALSEDVNVVFQVGKIVVHVLRFQPVKGGVKLGQWGGVKVGQ
jgi:hypothetical protein